MNKLYQQMQMQNLSSNSNIKQMMNMIKFAQNPQQALTTLAMQNPQVQNVLNLINQSGKNPKDLFYEMAGKLGVDPNEVLKMLR